MATGMLDPSLPFPTLFTVCKVASPVSTADSESDEHQHCHDHQDSTNYPTNVEVIWQRQKPQSSNFLKAVTIFYLCMH